MIFFLLNNWPRDKNNNSPSLPPDKALEQSNVSGAIRQCSVYGYVDIYNTVDMQAGKIIYLNDLIEVDEELVQQILTSGYVHLQDPYADKYEVFPQEVLDKMDKGEMLQNLLTCSEPYTAENYQSKSAFYLTRGRLYLVDVRPSSENSKFYINVEDLAPYLKVEPW